MIDENDEFIKLVKIALIIGSLIFLTVGFAFGYLYVDKGCNNNPLLYGIKELNKFNKDKFTCTCISNSGSMKPFSFDEDGLRENIFSINKK